MPIYEYECESCGGRFEVSRKFSDPAVTVCRLCNASNVRKLLSPTTFVLKGGGWYATDYASKDGKKEAGPENPKEETKADAGCSPAACASGACPSKN